MWKVFILNTLSIFFIYHHDSFVRFIQVQLASIQRSGKSLIWFPGQVDIRGNDVADSLGKQGAKWIPTKKRLLFNVVFFVNTVTKN